MLNRSPVNCSIFNTLLFFISYPDHYLSRLLLFPHHELFFFHLFTSKKFDYGNISSLWSKS